MHLHGEKTMQARKSGAEVDMTDALGDGGAISKSIAAVHIASQLLNRVEDKRRTLL